MRENARALVQTPGRLDDLLLGTRIRPPEPQPGGVSRAGPIESARASGCRVVTVTAPAGYGKSTLLAQWANTDDRRVAWVSLDRFDDDPAALVKLLATAWVQISAEDAELVADVSGAGVSVLGRAAPRLAAALRVSADPFVLILDDVHELRSPACHDVLTVVVGGVPRGSQLVTASRAELPLLARLRASGDAFELAVNDLALDEAGVEQIFAQADIKLPAESAAMLVSRTEGWPVGLRLAALIARETADGALEISGDDRYVADYLYQEALLRLPDDERRFLRRTAVLDQLCAPLCDAVVGEAGAHERLRDFEAASLFLIPMDRRREWFRYHGLFREFLLAELARVEPQVVSDLHRRAADWYEANGLSALALEHLLAIDEPAPSVRLVTKLALPTFQSGQVATVRRWLSTLGDSAVEAYPPLAAIAGWIAMFSGEVAESDRWAAFVEEASFDLTPTDGTASFDSARAMLRAAMCPSGPAQMLVDATFAVAQEPPWSPWRATALTTLAEAHLLHGDVEAASALFRDASAVGARLHNTNARVVSEAELALLAIERNQWSQAAEHGAVALAVIDEHRMHDYPTSVLAFAAGAWLAVHGGDLKEANRHLTLAMRARPLLTVALPSFAVRGRLQVAKLSWAIADFPAARQLLREIEDILLRRPDLGTLTSEASEFRRVVTSNAVPRGTGATPLSPAELRLLPYLQTHLTARDIAERLFVSRNTVSTQMRSIYRKLGVSSRTGAVGQATAIGLLAG